MNDNNLEIINKWDAPYGIRNNTGYLLFFADIKRWPGQEERYISEVEQQRELAEHLLEAIKNKQTLDVSMNKDELIAKQQLEIEELNLAVKQYKEAEESIYNIIYCIGGPLNDNKLGYTKKQMLDFFRIKEELVL